MEAKWRFGDQRSRQLQDSCIFVRVPFTAASSAIFADDNTGVDHVYRDTPSDMRISFMKASHGRKMHHLRTVQGSKGVGEPPLTLGCFHFFAIKDAVRSARIDHGLPKADFDLDAPATPERIRLACGDLLAKQAMVKPKDENERDFFVRIS